ncbi:MAG: tetratricopeptide repeat protein [Candidatus Marinimicrobia bacterium]|nr:tetratricopeptide repeat protein [Candidatus Neomarinimicrobiota bacterium]
MAQRKVTQIIFIIFLLNPHAGVSQSNDQVFVGTRPLGMGGTFVALADDGNTIYWNPAGLPGLRRHEITTTYSNLFGLGIINSYLGYVFPLRDELAVGVDWYYLGYSDDELEYSRSKFNFSFGFQPIRKLSLGTNVKILLNDMSLDGTSYGKSSGIGWDVGLLFSPWQRFRIGIAVYDLTGTSVTYNNSMREEVLGQRFKGGVAWLPMEGVILAIDVDDRWHFGAEYWILNALGIRMGVQQDRKIIDKASSPLIPSFGISFRHKAVRIDYGFEVNPLLFPTHRISLSFQFRPALVSIKSAAIQHAPLFRSLHHYYEDQEFAQVTLKNSAEKDLPVKVSLFVPTMMETPHEEQIVLPAKTTDDYPLGVTFSDNILTSSRATFDNLVQPEVKVVYTQENQEKFAVRKIDPAYVLGRGKINWDEPERIASFVTPEDPVVDQFARYLIQYYNPILKDFLNKSNLGKAIILFDALGTLGVTYSPDLQTPFLQISKDRTAFDTVKYPGELLKVKIGDCDDLTVLYGSLLENLGIATIFLDVFAPGEGHIFLMFDSGVLIEDISSMFLDVHEVAVLDGRVWIPIETTLIGEPFFTAWQQGVFEYHKRKNEGLINEVDIRRAQGEYRPGSIEVAEVPFPELKGVNDLLKTDLKQYGLWLQQIVLQRIQVLKSAGDYYNAGAIYLEFSRLTEALEMFNTALNMNPGFPDAQNSLGVVYTMKGNYEQAMDYYERALELFPNHPGYKLNIAITNFLQGNKTLAKQEYDEAVKLDSRFTGELDLLLGLKKGKDLPTAKQIAEQTGKLPEVTLADELELSSALETIEKKDEQPISLPIDKATLTYRKTKAKSDNSVGLVFARRGNLRMAVEFFEKAHSADPEKIDYLINLTLAHYLQGQYAAALKGYEQIIRSNPELGYQLKFIESRGQEKPRIKRFE